MKQLTLALWIVAMMVPASAFAIPLTTSESIDGDYSNDSTFPTDLGAFDVGMNLVSGNAGGEADILDTRDVWSANLGPGLEITSIQLTITNLTTTGPGFIFVQGVVYTSFLTQFSESFSGNTVITRNFTNLNTAGQFHFDLPEGGSLVDSYDWEWKTTVRQIPSPPAIPEPSTMLLFGSGIVGLAAWRWKRARQA